MRPDPLTLVFILLSLRGLWTSLRLLIAHVRQRADALLEVEEGSRTDERRIAVRGIVFRALRLGVSMLALGIGVGALFPPATRSPLYAIGFVVFIFGLVLTVDFVNEYDYWLLRLGWPWTWLGR